MEAGADSCPTFKLYFAAAKETEGTLNKIVKTIIALKIATNFVFFALTEIPS